MSLRGTWVRLKALPPPNGMTGELNPLAASLVAAEEDRKRQEGPTAGLPAWARNAIEGG